DRINLAYTAGAFRDCTRVALINPELWTELFMINGSNTVKEIDKYINSLTKMRNAISEKDEKSLYEMLKIVRNNKEDILKREPKKGIVL
ncbi:MAG: prephenate dehydrogenase dimerization domain-containing protein, partial [Monoglobaceae bacterium]